MARLTEEQAMLRDAAQAWTQDESPVGALRKMRDSGEPLGFAAPTWKARADLGWAGVVSRLFGS